KVIDDVFGDARRLDAVHDQADDAEAPAGAVPLRLDREETVTRKERRPALDPASVREPMLAQPRKIRLVARQAKTTERELLAVWLQACDRPVRHWDTHQNQLRDRRSRG